MGGTGLQGLQTRLRGWDQVLQWGLGPFWGCGEGAAVQEVQKRLTMSWLEARGLGRPGLLVSGFAGSTEDSLPLAPSCREDAVFEVSLVPQKVGEGLEGPPHAPVNQPEAWPGAAGRTPVAVGIQGARATTRTAEAEPPRNAGLEQTLLGQMRRGGGFPKLSWSQSAYWTQEKAGPSEDRREGPQIQKL